MYAGGKDLQSIPFHEKSKVQESVQRMLPSIYYRKCILIICAFIFIEDFWKFTKVTVKLCL